MFFLVAVKTKYLYVFKGVRLFETGKLSHWYNVVQLRCFREDQTSAVAALVSVTVQGFQSDVPVKITWKMRLSLKNAAFRLKSAPSTLF